MSRCRDVAAVVAAALLAGGLALAPPAGAAAHAAPAGEPTLGPLISGRSSYVDGTYVWTDYAYDDRGADTNSTPGGDVRYPADLSPNNVADLIQLQVSEAEPGWLDLTAVLETLTDSTRPLVGVALDRDGNAETGATTLPGSWTASGPLGVDTLVVLGRSGGERREWRDGAWTRTHELPVHVDPEANTLRTTVVFDLPSSGALRAVAAVGYEDADGHSWLTGDTPVHDLAFVVGEKPTTPYLQSVAAGVTGFGSDGEKQWQEYLQSAILGGKADPAPAVAAIDVAALRDGRTELAAPDKKGFHTFLYKSRLDLGEGVEGSGNAAIYKGPYQPYLVWVPESLRPGLPLVLYLHGSSQTHLSAVNTAHYDPSTVDPVLRKPDAIFDFRAVVAWPLGRGPQTWYEGAAELDPIEVADDVIARLSLDRDRVMLAGLSMGGFGTFKLAEHYPDRWSVAYIDVAGDQTRLPENLTALPVRLQNGVLDPLIPLANLAEGEDPTPATATRALLDSAGTVDYRSWVLARGTHGPAVALAECVYRQSFRTPRLKNPPRVRYTVDPSTFFDDPETGVQIRYDGAYWVSGLRTTGGRGSVDLTTSALGWVPQPGPTTSGGFENATAGRDFCGENPDVMTRDAWTEQARTVTRQRVPRERRLTGTLTGLSAATIDADRAGLGGQRPATLALTTTDPMSLTLTGLRPEAAVTRGSRTVRADGSGTATVVLGRGPNVVTVG